MIDSCFIPSRCKDSRFKDQYRCSILIGNLKFSKVNKFCETFSKRIEYGKSQNVDFKEGWEDIINVIDDRIIA